MCKKKLYVVSAAIVTVIAVVIFFPVMGAAGSLEPSAAPAPTMKTLDQIPPTWSIKIPGADRFVVLADFDNAAVLDKETGLVWEKSPAPTNFASWAGAFHGCSSKYIGGRLGWHLPTIEQLASLANSFADTAPRLPSWHPFINVQPSQYWSATTYTYLTTYAEALDFSSAATMVDTKGNSKLMWCVRGGQSSDGQ